MIASSLETGTGTRELAIVMSTTKTMLKKTNVRACLFLKNLHRAKRQAFAIPFRNQIGILDANAPQSGIEDLGLDRKDDSRFKRRIELRRNHRSLVQLQPDTVGDKSDLIFSGAHEVI